MGIWCFLKLVIVYVLRYDFLDTFRLRVYKSKKSSFERKIQAGKPGFFFVFFYHLSSISLTKMATSELALLTSIPKTTRMILPLCLE